MLEITSKNNAHLKHARAVRQGRAHNLIFIEGLRLSEELVTAGLEITDYFFTAELAHNERGARLLEKLPPEGGSLISETLLESIADTKTPPGIIVLANKPKVGRANLETFLSAQTPLLVVLHQLNNPANIGAILRTAEAAGCAGAILTVNCADAFSPKSLRGAMGSAFRLPLWTNAGFGEVVKFCRENKIRTVGSDLNALKTHTEVDWATISRALIIGPEAHGLTPAETALIDESVQIPMQPPVESLNAAVACGVILYEAARQKIAFKESS